MVIIRKHLEKTKATSYKAKLMHLEDDMGCYTNEMREQAETIAYDLRDIAYYIVEKVIFDKEKPGTELPCSTQYFKANSRGGCLREYARVVAGMDDEEFDSELLIYHGLMSPRMIKGQKGKYSGDLVEMPSEAVEQEMDDHAPDDIDGAKGEHVPNHVELDNKRYRDHLYEMHLLLNPLQIKELENEVRSREELAVLQVEFADMEGQMQQLMEELKKSQNNAFFWKSTVILFSLVASFMFVMN
ncbi:hypothetical protein Tco_0189876 [Tanacetum coccineum]